jgi:hypothetical protein
MLFILDWCEQFLYAVHDRQLLASASASMLPTQLAHAWAENVNGACRSHPARFNQLLEDLMTVETSDQDATSSGLPSRRRILRGGVLVSGAALAAGAGAAAGLANAAPAALSVKSNETVVVS